MLKQVIFFIAVMTSPLVQADSLNLVINGKALHAEKKNLNEDNWGLGFEYNFEERNHWTPFINGGYFLDSFSEISRYLGGGSKRRFYLQADKQGWFVDAGISAFLMTRKDVNNEQPFFGALPFVSVGKGPVAINVTYIPAVSPKFTSLWFVQATVKLGSW